MKIDPGRFGVRLGEADIVNCCTDGRGVVWLIKTARQQAIIRITPSGLLRIGEPTRVQEHPSVNG